ncbi:hypothetical protein JRQ81_014577 [Phrynocephalus forsythii]|uniref:Uncharacterized protein n=1 Tax=Phrynocephalus forsythii TaxID=171643 RepID=A0A9Q0Y084_9SAUR|nr:hypothetical protein JRQ81_014577 [Phrynocephalus forsythii]
MNRTLFFFFRGKEHKQRSKRHPLKSCWCQTILYHAVDHVLLTHYLPQKKGMGWWWGSMSPNGRAKPYRNWSHHKSYAHQRAFGLGTISHMQQNRENKKFWKRMPSAQRQLMTVSEAEEPNGSCPILAGSKKCNN